MIGVKNILAAGAGFFLCCTVSCTAHKTIAAGTATNRDSQVLFSVDVSAPGVGEKINRHLQQLQGFSGAVIVEVGNEKILQAGYGFADRENKVPYTTRTISDLASLTKQFTAATIVSLSQQGHFNLQDSLGKFFPELQPPQSTITVDQVLTHSAGLSEYSGPDYKELSKEKFLYNVSREKLRFKPGEKYLYSNTGYSVLALIIEKVTNDDFEKLVSGLFFEPNHLSIGFNLRHFKPTDFATYYQKGRNKGNSYLKKKALKENYWALKGNAGFYASAEEMYKWHKVLQNDLLISPTIKAALYRPRFRRGDQLYYGYGWNVRTDQDGKVNQVSHGGSDDIMSCYWMELPAKKTWIYVSSNTSEFKATAVTLDILNIISGRD